MINAHGNLRIWSVCPRCLDPYDSASCPRCGEFARHHGPPPPPTAGAHSVGAAPAGRVLPLLGLALPIVSGIVGLLIWSL